MATYASNVRAAESAQDKPYLLDSITQSTSPTKTDEADWYRYVINQGHNQIVGYRRGDPQSVRKDVDLIVDQLNSRRTVKSGRKHISLGPAAKASS
jgi:hypothetical protein